MTSPDDVNLLLVTCGSVSAKFDLNLFRSESALGKKSIKCVLVGSEWVTPAKLETMGGKGSTRNWKRSIVYNKAPISTILFSGGVSQGTSEGSQQSMATPPAAASAATPDQISHSASNPKGLLCCPILAFIKASRLRKDAATIKKVLIDSFRDVDLSEAMKNLWDFSQIKLASLDYDYHARRVTGKRPANVAVCEDLLLAFDKLDSAASLPPIYCEADQLLRIPSLSTGNAANEVVDKLHTEVSDITANLVSNRDRMNELEQQFSSSCAAMKETFHSSISALSAEISAFKEKISQYSARSNTQVVPQLSTNTEHRRGRTDGVDRSANIIFFGLPEGPLVSTRELVDEISSFLIGSVVGVKDLFRVGKRSDGRCRPTLVKFGTVWDKRLLLAAKTKLKSFRQRGIFGRQDMSKDERLAAIARRTNARSQHSSAEVPHKSSPHHPLSSPNPSSHSFPSSPVLFGPNNQD